MKWPTEFTVFAVRQTHCKYSADDQLMSSATPIPAAGSSLNPQSVDGAHVVQFYEQDSFLLDQLSRFIGTALGGGDAAVVIATKAHREGLSQRLKARGLDIAKAAKQGRYIALDAAETLASLSVGGQPDPERFVAIIGPVLERARNAAEGENPQIAAFGEMVALLWSEGNPDGAIKLEQYWNLLGKIHPFTLWCGYPLAEFAKKEHADLFQRICAEHSAVIPNENYMALATEEMKLRAIATLQQKAQALDSEQALRRSEERFRQLVEAAQDYAIFMLDPNGCVSSWNAGAERIKGYRPAEIIGRHFSTFYPEEDIRAGKPTRELEIAVKDGRVEDEGWRVRKDGSRFWANVIIMALRDDHGNLIGFSKITRDFTERMRAHTALEAVKKKLEESEGSLRELSRHLLRTQDEERRKIGRDLHDSLGQYLSVLKMKLASLKSAGKHNGTAAQDLAECVELADESLKEVRTASYLLYPPMLEEFGLKSAISWYVDGFSTRSGIETSFHVQENFGRLQEDAELALFRVLQESLTNVHRHSGSTTAEVRLSSRDGWAVLEIRDQGKGIPGHSEQSEQGFVGRLGVGMRGMNERMRQLGGKIELKSSSRGTTVTAMIPNEQPANG